MNRYTILSIVISALIIGGAIYFTLDNDSENGPTNYSNVEIVDDIQYVTVLAKGGYSPRVSKIEAGIPTKLIVKTDNTYDCSSALVIRSINFQKYLESSGEEIIDLGVLEEGQKISGTCSMGMYSFTIKAE